MRKAALTSLVFVACGFATNAQFSITPKLGIEQSFTGVQYNTMPSFSPMGSGVSPQLGIRADYLFKKAHGPFIGVATNRSLIVYQFTNPETGNKTYTATRGDWQLRLEAGYQVSSKPIALGKATKPATSTIAKSACAARCAQTKAAAAKKAVMNMRIQPYAGMAFIPGTPGDVNSAFKNNETVYEYNAGNWNSAFITGINFAFAKGNARKMVVGVQYLKGIGNMNTQTLTTGLDNKQLTTQLASTASAWNVSVGIPISFNKKEVVKAKPAPPVQAPVKKSCGYYRSRCFQ